MPDRNNPSHPPKRGQVIPERIFRELATSRNETRQHAGGAGSAQTPHGTVAREQGRAQAAPITLFRVQTDHDNYVEAKQWNAQGSDFVGVTVNIAKGPNAEIRSGYYAPASGDYKGSFIEATPRRAQVDPDSGTDKVWCDWSEVRNLVWAEFPAKITGHATLGSGSTTLGGGASITVVYSWKYAWTEVTLDGDGDGAKASARSGTTGIDYAVNIREMNHTARYSWGVDVNNADYPENYRPQPVGSTSQGSAAGITHSYDDVVWMREATDINGNKKYYFQAFGSHDGDCD